MTGASRGKKSRTPLSNAERQQRFRERRDARLRELEQYAALRNAKGDRTVPPLRNVVSISELTPDDQLTQLRRRGDQLAAAYAALAPNLSPAEIQTVRARFLEWRELAVATAPTRSARTSIRKHHPKEKR